MRNNLPPSKCSREYSAILTELLARGSNAKLGLGRMKDLASSLGFADRSMRVVQIVGTNGKGSTSAFVESILLKNGLSTGLFTSPHLCSARERIRINGRMIEEDGFIRAGRAVLAACSKLCDPPSFFECLLGIALLSFLEAGIDIAILEAGLGGRLDATTALKPDLLGVSSIDLDHQDILGYSIAAIAQEKLAAARWGQTVMAAPQSWEVKRAMTRSQREIGFKLFWAVPCDQPLGLFGEHQRINAGLAMGLVQALGIKTEKSKDLDGLLGVDWPARFEVLARPCPVILDGAHNPSGIESLIRGIKAHAGFRDRDLFVIYGSMSGPNAEEKIKRLADSGLPIARIYLHRPQNCRAMSEPKLKELFRQFFSESSLYHFDALGAIIDSASLAQAAILVCGSLYTVGEIRGGLLDIPMDGEMPNH